MCFEFSVSFPNRLNIRQQLHLKLGQLWVHLWNFLATLTSNLDRVYVQDSLVWKWRAEEIIVVHINRSARKSQYRSIIWNFAYSFDFSDCRNKIKDSTRCDFFPEKRRVGVDFNSILTQFHKGPWCWSIIYYNTCQMEEHFFVKMRCFKLQPPFMIHLFAEFSRLLRNLTKLSAKTELGNKLNWQNSIAKMHFWPGVTLTAIFNAII